MPRSSGTYLKSAFKLLVGALLIFYVFRSKMIDFGAVKTMLLDPLNLVVGFGFLGFSLICCATRWYLLAKKQGLSLSYRNMIELTMIGNFFNSFMPGSVGGDVIKAWYVAGREPKRKTRAILTVLLDRILGLSVIVFCSAATLAAFPAWMSGRKELVVVATLIWSFTTASIIVGGFFFLSTRMNLTFPAWAKKYLDKVPPAGKAIEAVLLYRRHPGVVIIALFLSAASIVGTIVFYQLQGNALGVSMTTPEYFFVVPLALTLSAIPVLPGGIGVGQIAFFNLFKWLGNPNPEMGATLCTLMQAYTLLFNCLGAFVYMKFKRKPGEGLEESSSLEKGPMTAAFTAVATSDG